MAAQEMSTLYGRDFFDWTAKVAPSSVNAGSPRSIVSTWPREIEDVGKTDERGVRGHMRIVIHQLFKWQFQRERRRRSWETSHWTHRDALADRFAQLRRAMSETPSVSRRPGPTRASRSSTSISSPNRS